MKKIQNLRNIINKNWNGVVRIIDEEYKKAEGNYKKQLEELMLEGIILHGCLPGEDYEYTYLTLEELMDEHYECQRNGECYEAYDFIDLYEEDIEHLSKDDKYYFYKYMYITCDEVDYVLRLFLNHVNKYGIPQDEQDNTIKNIGVNEVTIYRGISKYNNPYGHSWTLNKKKAEMFANRTFGFGDADKNNNGKILKRVITYKDVIFYDNSRFEEEVFIK